jgi:thiol-disulfide isomerase/thioredoxin
MNFDGLKSNWSYIVIAFLLLVIICMYTIHGKMCNMEQPVVGNEGYNPILNSILNHHALNDLKTEPYDGEKIETTVKDNSDGELVLYYATWCGFSRMFLPEWEKFEVVAKTRFPNLDIKQFKCEDGDEATCFQKGVEGYPTVILYPKNGTEVVFQSDRSAENLVKFVETHI